MKAYELLAKPESWTQGAFARDAEGRATQDLMQSACWCVAGAIKRCYESRVDRQKALDRLEDETGWYAIPPWNDDPARTHAEVVDLLRRLDI